MHSIVDFLKFRSQIKPNGIAFTFIEDDGRKHQLFFHELHQSALAVGSCLAAKVEPGEAVVLLLPQGLEYIKVFLGCLYAGVVAVPLYPPQSTNHSERVLSVIKDCDAKFALTSDKLKPVLMERLSPLLVLGFTELSAMHDNSFQPAVTAEQLAFLQYTSGSTGTPKGVMVSHGNVIANLKSLQEASQCTTKDVYCNWLPLFHDFGLVNTLLLPIYLGCHSVLMSPSRFIKRPSVWFEAITEYKGTICGAPNFAYDYCVSRITNDQLKAIDLSSWRGAVNSAEPVDANTIKKFVECFSSVGFKATAFYPCYGMAEATLFIAGGEHLSAPITQSFKNKSLQLGIVEVGSVTSGNKILVSSGKALSNHTIKIVDPELNIELSDDRVGEIWFAGPSVAQGYWNDVEKTNASFGARLLNDNRKYLRTGDLGFIYQGELYISGRLKDVLIIKGRNYYPQDLEKVAYGSCDGLSQGGAAAFEVEGRAILIQEIEVRAQKQFNYSLACKNIQSAIFEQFEILLDDIVFVSARKISKTSSGKIQRSLAKKQYLANAVVALYSLKENVIQSSPNENSSISVLEQQLYFIWQETLGIEKIGVDENFFMVGGQSLLATRLIAKIGEEFDCQLSIKDLFNNPSIRELANLISTVKLSGAQSILKVLNNQPKKLSFAQQRLWLLEHISDGKLAHYNLPFFLKLSGLLNAQALTSAFSSIVSRHESLRTCFAIDDDGQPIQVIQEARPFQFQITDLSALEEGDCQLQLAGLIGEESRRAFDLSRDLMLRGQLVKIANDEHIVLVTMHHIASDGWSMSILINEFSALYSAYVQGKEDPLIPLPIQYADYAHWQRNWLQDNVLDQQLEYWTRQLAGLPVVHSLPLDHVRPQIQTFSGNTISSHIDAQTNKTLNVLCHAHGATLFMGLHAAFSVLLSRYSNETDIVIGSFIANREQKEVVGLIGFFINSLVLRSDLSGNPSFNDLIKQSKVMLLEAYAHQQVPFEQIVERLHPERSLSHSALFQIMLILQNNEQGALELPELTLDSATLISTGISEFDLTLEVSENDQGLTLDWKYNTDLFEQETIVRMATHFALLLKALVIQPDENVFGIDMLTAEERQQLLVDWNNTQSDYPKEKCIHELFEEQVKSNPNAIAVVFENQQISYNELNQKANQLAHYLINEKQVKPDTFVGICVERSLGMMVGILAILKAGGAYVPLDPTYPEARLKYMLDDANLTTVLTQRHLRETTPVTDEQAVCLDAEDIQQQLQTLSTQNPNLQQLGLHSSHLAYVIYTSGSTGNPKGVMIVHEGLVNLVGALRDAYKLTSADSILQFAPISFDMSVEEMFGALCNGCTLVLRTESWLESVNQFWRHCSVAKITVLNLPTAFWHELARDKRAVQASSVRHISIGGEKINELAVRDWFEKNTSLSVLLNAYGPTEYTVNASFAEVNAGYGNSIGKALHNTQLLVMNASGVLSPVGVCGELYLGGVGLARGYLNRSDLTAEKFVANPFYDKNDRSSSERLYKTGDLVRWLPDGQLEFMGRIDHQVKIRGFRIELGEIEKALSAYFSVKDAIVIAKETSSGDKRLVAYVAVDEITDNGSLGNDSAINMDLIESLRHHLNQSLPNYMLPSAFVLLREFPLTPNGKVDRKALPESDISVQQSTYIEPRTKTEKVLCEIWQEVLGVERVGITDNFFQLGGHSLLLVKLIRVLESRFNIEGLEASVIFQTPTVKALATYLSVLCPVKSNEQEELDGQEMEFFQL